MLEINSLKKSWTLNLNQLLLQKCMLPLQYLSDPHLHGIYVSTWHICLTEILEAKHFKFGDYLN